MCKDMPKFMCKPDSMVATRAPFVKHDLWVTPFKESQIYPCVAGPFPTIRHKLTKSLTGPAGSFRRP